MAANIIERRIISQTFRARGPVCPSCRFASLIGSHTARRHATTDATPPRLAELPIDPGTGLKQKLARTRGQGDQPVPQAQGARGSLFDEVDQESREERKSRGLYEDEPNFPYLDLDPGALLNIIDPRIEKRKAWERKQIVKSVKARGKLSKTERISQKERECQVASQTFKTSTKKLMMLARQIAGKPIDEAIVQMQFSKKRVAWDIMKHLEYARDTAIVSRGMGLGKANGMKGEKVQIEDKDGKEHKITDRTGIYIDQAWVNKGAEYMTRDFRGRGRVMTLTHRSAKITVRLKEEHTRIREAKQREKKEKKRSLWLHLPDRPITLQRQYPLW